MEAPVGALSTEIDNGFQEFWKRSGGSKSVLRMEVAQSSVPVHIAEVGHLERSTT